MVCLKQKKWLNFGLLLRKLIHHHVYMCRGSIESAVSKVVLTVLILCGRQALMMIASTPCGKLASRRRIAYLTIFKGKVTISSSVIMTGKQPRGMKVQKHFGSQRRLQPSFVIQPAAVRLQWQ